MKKRKAKRMLMARKHVSQSGFGYELPPDFTLVSIYFNQKGHQENADTFYQHYQQSDWKSETGSPIKNWKVAATDWIFNHDLSKKLADRKIRNVI